MKAKTPGAAASGDEGAVESAPKRRRGDRFRHLIGEMWPAYLIEIVVIILGISITLALEEWRGGAKEENLRNIYSGNLLADINTDLGGLQNASTETMSLLAKGREILQFDKVTPTHTLSDSALIEDLRGILGRPKFISQEATFQDLKSSGNLHLIKDIALKGMLFAYYNLVQHIEENQEAEQQATIILVGPYFLQRFQMDGGLEDSPALDGREKPTAFANDVEFRNLVLLRVATRKELLALYKDAESLANKLKSALQKN